MDTGIVDQRNEVAAGHGAVNIQRENLVSQVIVPELPVLRAVEVALMTGNPGRGGDRVTLTVLDGPTELVSVSEDIPEGFDGYYRFELPDGGLEVTVGKPLTLRLADTQKIVFWWKYSGGDRYPAGQAWFYGAPWADHDFFFRTYGVGEPDLTVMRTTAAVTQRTGSGAIPYRSPSGAELTAGKKGIEQLRAGNVAGARTTLAPLGFTVTSGTDPITTRPYALAVSELGTSREWGLFLVDPSVPTSVCLAVPHTHFDEVCEWLAMRLWRAIPGGMLMMATVHRGTTWQNGKEPEADLAQNTDSLFQHVWTDSLGMTLVPQIQIHGFRDRAEVESLKDVRVVVSVGSADLTALPQNIAHKLSDAGVNTAIGWSNPSQDLIDAKLLATTNEQGKAATGKGWVWVHLEVARSLRHAAPPTPWYLAMDAVRAANPEKP